MENGHEIPPLYQPGPEKGKAPFIHVSEDMWKEHNQRQAWQKVLRVCKTICKGAGMLMIAVSVIIFASEANDGNPIIMLLLQYLGATTMAIVGYSLYRVGGGRSFQELDMFD